jgi:hypothetical protein
MIRSARHATFTIERAGREHGTRLHLERFAHHLHEAPALR